MSVVYGDIREITYNHPTLGSGTYFPKAGEQSSFDPGGFRGEDDAQMVDGGGRNMKKLTQNRWSAEAVVSWDANVTNELDTLKKLAADPVDGDYTISLVNGTVWGGKGSPVGDVKGDVSSGTIALKLAGGGELKKIVG